MNNHGLVKNLFHINIVAVDFEKVLHFYRDICGCEQMFVVSQGAFRQMFGETPTAEEEKTTRLTYLRVAPEQYIELVNGLIKPSMPQRSHTNTFNHMSLLTENLDFTVNTLEKEDIPVFQNPTEQTVGEYNCDNLGRRYAWIRDPEGTLIKIMEMSK